MPGTGAPLCAAPPTARTPCTAGRLGDKAGGGRPLGGRGAGGWGTRLEAAGPWGGEGQAAGAQAGGGGPLQGLLLCPGG